MLLLARLFQLGFVADFLSRTVLVGFLTGVGLQVGIAMLGDMLGLAVQSHLTLPQLAELAHQLSDIDGRQAALSAAVLAAVWAGQRYMPRAPVGLLAVVGCIGASAAFGFGQSGIQVLGPVPGGMPSLAFPSLAWREVLALLPVAASCVVMIVAQSAATSRSFAQRHGETVDANRDLLGLSAANAAAACSGSFVVNGSPTQTAMADAAGARSQLAQLSFAAAALGVLLFLTGPLQYLPRCVLGALVFTIAVRMIDHRGLRDIRRESRSEYRLAVLTALAVVAIGVESGILLAIALSLLRHVRHSWRPHTGVLVRDAQGEWQSTPCKAGAITEPGVLVYRFGADLFYANEQRFVDEVRRLVDGAPPPLRALVVDASAIADLDYSAALALRKLVADLQQRRILLVFGRVSDALRADMERHRISTAVSAAHLHGSLHEALADARLGWRDDARRSEERPA
jgi:MFS superfamily sulfate permease-like transporter